jgi:hypothetical protein
VQSLLHLVAPHIHQLGQLVTHLCVRRGGRCVCGRGGGRAWVEGG